MRKGSLFVPGYWQLVTFGRRAMGVGESMLKIDAGVAFHGGMEPHPARVGRGEGGVMMSVPDLSRFHPRMDDGRPHRVTGRGPVSRPHVGATLCTIHVWFEYPESVFHDLLEAVLLIETGGYVRGLSGMV